MTIHMKCPQCGSKAEWKRETDHHLGPFAEGIGPEETYAGYFCAECEWEYEPDDGIPTANPSVAKVIYDVGMGESYQDFYRMIYKATVCGPTIGFLFEEGWVYNSDLPDKSPDHIPAFGISVSSIVEGPDVEVAPRILIDEFSVEVFWEAVEEVDQESDRIWNELYPDNNDNEGETYDQFWVPQPY